MTVETPVFAWGLIGLVFAGFLYIFGGWAIAHGLIKHEDSDIVLGMVTIMFGFVSVIASLWHFGLV